MLMDAKKILNAIEGFDYWDTGVSKLETNYLADEVEIRHEDEETTEIVYKFTGCYRVYFDHVKGYSKGRPVKEMTRGQIPYFMQDVDVSTIIEDEVEFYVCKIDMFPMEVEIWCKDIEVFKMDKSI